MFFFYRSGHITQMGKRSKHGLYKYHVLHVGEKFNNEYNGDKSFLVCYNKVNLEPGYSDI